MKVWHINASILAIPLAMAGGSAQAQEVDANYSDAKLDEDLPAGNSGFAGDRSRYVPDVTLNVSADFGRRYVTNARGLTSLGGYLSRPGTNLAATSIRPRTFGLTAAAEF